MKNIWIRKSWVTNNHLLTLYSQIEKTQSIRTGYYTDEQSFASFLLFFFSGRTNLPVLIVLSFVLITSIQIHIEIEREVVNKT